MTPTTQLYRLRQVRMVRWLLADGLQTPDAIEERLLERYIAGRLDLDHLLTLLAQHHAEPAAQQ